MNNKIKFKKIKMILILTLTICAIKLYKNIKHSSDSIIEVKDECLGMKSVCEGRIVEIIEHEEQPVRIIREGK